MSTKQLNATDDDVAAFTVTRVCPIGLYIFTIAAVNEFDAVGEFDDGTTADVVDETSTCRSSTACKYPEKKRLKPKKSVTLFCGHFCNNDDALILPYMQWC